MHMNTRKHFSGNRSVRKVTRIRNHSVYNQTRVSKLQPTTIGNWGGKYIVKIYKGFQTLGNKFQQGLFQLQHKKRIRLTRKHVSGSQSVRKLTMIQIILIITQNYIKKQNKTKRDWSSREHKWQSYWALNWALNTSIILNDAMTAHCWDCSKLDQHEIQVIWDLYSCAVSSCEHSVRSVT